MKKVHESCETERISDELVVLEEVYSDDSGLNVEYNTSDLEEGNIDFVVTEFHRKDEIRCGKEKLMACKETKSPVKRKRKYTPRKDRNENTILQQDKRAKVDEATKKNILGDNTKQHQQRRKILEATKSNIQAENANQHQQRRKNLDEITKKNIKTENTKQHQQRIKYLDETTKGNIQDKDTKQHQERRKNLDETTKKNIKTGNTKQQQERSNDEITKKSIQDKHTKQH